MSLENESGSHAELTSKQEEAKEEDGEHEKSSYETLSNVSKSVNLITAKALEKAHCQTDEESRTSPSREKYPVNTLENVDLRGSKPDISF